MFSSRNEDYVAAVVGVPIPGLVNLAGIAFFSQSRKTWLVEGRVIIEDSTERIEQFDKRTFIKGKPCNDEIEALNQLRHILVQFREWYGDEIDSPDGFRLVRKVGLDAACEAWNSIPGVTIGRHDPEYGALATPHALGITDPAEGEQPTCM